MSINVDLDVGRHDRLFVLQAVARADLDEAHRARTDPANAIAALMRRFPRRPRCRRDRRPRRRDRRRRNGRRHAAGRGCDDRVLHLHRLEHDQRRALVDRVADVDHAPRRSCPTSAPSGARHARRLRRVRERIDAGEAHARARARTRAAHSPSRTTVHDVIIETAVRAMRSASPPRLGAQLVLDAVGSHGEPAVRARLDGQRMRVARLRRTRTAK